MINRKTAGKLDDFDSFTDFNRFWSLQRLKKFLDEIFMVSKPLKSLRYSQILKHVRYFYKTTAYFIMDQNLFAISKCLFFQNTPSKLLKLLEHFQNLLIHHYLDSPFLVYHSRPTPIRATVLFSPFFVPTITNELLSFWS